MEKDIFSNEELLRFVQKQPRPRCDSRMSLCLPSKGLYNAPGENNCFLNAAVQILWHLNAFRRSFRLLQGHACLDNACVFCALKRIFRQFQDSEALALDPEDLRTAMANAFADEHRFQLGRMDDAAECFENILNRLHNHIANSELDNACSASYCIPHQKFASHILEQDSCKCHATGEPKSFYQFVHYVSATALINFHQPDNGNQTLGDILKMTMQPGEPRSCPDSNRCLYKDMPENQTTVQTTLLNHPDVLTIGIIWDSDHPSPSFINDMMNCMQESLYLVDIFDNIPDKEYRCLEMKVVGVVCYYGKHYTSFFYDTCEQQWVYFDDAVVKKIGPSWKSVKDKCARSRFQPLLVVYANGTGLPIDARNAPRDVKLVSKEHLLSQPPRHRKHKRRRKKHTEDMKLKHLSLPKQRQKGVHGELVRSQTLTQVSNPENPAFRPLPSLPGITLPECINKNEKALKPKCLVERNSSGNSDVESLQQKRQWPGTIKQRFGIVMKNVKSKAKQKSADEKPIMRSSSLDSVLPCNNGTKHVLEKRKEASAELLNSLGQTEKTVLDLQHRIDSETNSDSRHASSDRLDYSFPNLSLECYPSESIDICDIQTVNCMVGQLEVDNQHNISEFDLLIHRAEGLLELSRESEELGDILLALNSCTEATSVFRKACKLVSHDNSLTRFVDEKRWSSFKRSQFLRQRANKFLNENHISEEHHKWSPLMPHPISSSTSVEARSVCVPNPPHDQQDFVTLPKRVTSLKEIFQVKTPPIPRKPLPLQHSNSDLPHIGFSNKNSLVSDTIYDNSLSTRDLARQHASNSHEQFESNGNDNLGTKEIRAKNNLETKDNRAKNNLERKEDVVATYESRSRNFKTNEFRATKQEIFPAFNSSQTNNTLAKLRGSRRLRCAQCGWRLVEFEGQCCRNCQSEYI